MIIEVSVSGIETSASKQARFPIIEIRAVHIVFRS